LQQSRDIVIKTVHAHELSPVPTPMFNDEGQMKSEEEAAGDCGAAFG